MFDDPHDVRRLAREEHLPVQWGEPVEELDAAAIARFDCWAAVVMRDAEVYNLPHLVSIRYKCAPCDETLESFARNNRYARSKP